jgi:hypothetical protein
MNIVELHECFIASEAQAESGGGVEKGKDEFLHVFHERVEEEGGEPPRIIRGGPGQDCLERDKIYKIYNEIE